jgi:hypothetical protein
VTQFLLLVLPDGNAAVLLTQHPEGRRLYGRERGHRIVAVKSAEGWQQRVDLVEA